MLIAIEDFETNHRRKVADDGRGYREEFRVRIYVVLQIFAAVIFVLDLLQ